MRAFLLWPVAILVIVVAGFSFALEHHRQSLNEELLRADQEATNLRRLRDITADDFREGTLRSLSKPHHLEHDF